MADDDPQAQLRRDECRDPSLEDLVGLCRELNRCGARYIIVGGFAIIQAGYPRHTNGIDLLVEVSPENESRLKEALATLPDNAIQDLKPGELDEFGVVRVADEFLVDLMKSGCGVDYAAAARDAVVRIIDGVAIPFASLGTLWRMKQTRREKDIPDRLFLRQRMEAEAIPMDPPPPDAGLGRLPGWLERLLQRFFP